MRFGLIYLVPRAGRGVAVGLGVKIATDRRPPPPPPWSAFHPTGTDVKAVAEIANYVQGQYQQANGKALTEVRGGPLVMGSQALQLAVRKDAVSNTVSAVDGVSVEYNMCGNADSCSVPKGVSPQRAGVLTRREAYQLAMLTFKYVPTRVERRRPDAAARQEHEGARDLHPPRHDVQRDLRRRSSRCPATRPRSTSSRSARPRSSRSDRPVHLLVDPRGRRLASRRSCQPDHLDVKDSIPPAGA